MVGKNPTYHYHYTALPTTPPDSATPQSAGGSSQVRGGRNGSGSGLNSSLYDNTGQGLPPDTLLPLENSLTSDSTATTKTGSTVRTFGGSKGGSRVPPSSAHSRGHPDELDLDHHMTESVQMEELLTDEVLVTHPRSLLILASLTAVISVQMAVLGMIGRFYEGCPYGTGIWVPLLCLAGTALGFTFLKLAPRRWVLYAYALATLVCLLLSLLLFVLTAHLLAQEDKVLSKRGWNFVEEHIFQLNRIVENTKIAMYSLHLIFTPILMICLSGTLFLLILNIREAAEGKVRRGYYVSSAAMGHQTVLVPVSVKQVGEMPAAQIHKSIAVQTNTHYVTSDA